MPKPWWRSARYLFVAQVVCLLAVFVWSVRHVPVQDSGPGKVEKISTGSDVSADAQRVVAPPIIPFHTGHPPAGSLDLRPLDVEAAPTTAPRDAGQFEFNGATVYVVPLTR